MDRRNFMAGAAITAALVAYPTIASAQRQNISRLPTRRVRDIEIVYRTPHGKPNGLDVTSEGMWIIDQGAENWASLINPDTGALIREFRTQNVRSASGIVVAEDDVMWIGSTYNRLIVAINHRTGETTGVYTTPGAGQIYRMAGDPPGRRTALEPAYPAPPPPPPNPNAPRTSGGSLGAGQLPLDAEEGPAGTGAHCPLSKGNLLYVNVPPARAIFVIDKATWEVQASFPTAGNRPHDMAWSSERKTAIWCSDSNLNAFFLHDAQTGRMTQRIQLPDDSPVIHGAKLYNGYMYCCDDVGWMFRFRM